MENATEIQLKLLRYNLGNNNILYNNWEPVFQSTVVLAVVLKMAAECRGKAWNSGVYSTPPCAGGTGAASQPTPPCFLPGVPVNIKVQVIQIFRCFGLSCFNFM